MQLSCFLLPKYSTGCLAKLEKFVVTKHVSIMLEVTLFFTLVMEAKEIRFEKYSTADFFNLFMTKNMCFRHFSIGLIELTQDSCTINHPTVAWQLAVTGRNF